MSATPGSQLNLKQAAASLGVHYMTAYRYVRTGRLPARRVGSGWVVAAEDLAVFAARPAVEGRGGGTAREPGARAVEGGGAGPAREPGAGAVEGLRSTAAGGQPGGHDRTVRWRSRLAWTLAAGDEPASWRILEDALAAGRSPVECYLDLVGGAIDDISGRAGEPDRPLAAEYLAVATASRLVARLGARFRRPGRSRGTVVFGAALGEHHTLPIQVVADLVRLEGFDCLELGADVPPAAFAGAAAGASRLVAVGIGMTRATALAGVRRTVEAVREVDAALPVVLGGQAATDPSVLAATGADAVAGDGRMAIEVFSELARMRRRLWAVDGGTRAAHRGR